MTTEEFKQIEERLGLEYHHKYEVYPEGEEEEGYSKRCLKANGFMHCVEIIREYKPNVDMKEKPLEIDLQKVNEIADKLDITPKQALEAFNEIYSVANPIIIRDEFFPPWSNKKIVDINNFTIVQIGQVRVGDSIDRRNELRLRVIQSGSPMTEHTIILPNPMTK